jgi:(+)-pinoresinol hydroxylase
MTARNLTLTASGAAFFVLLAALAALSQFAAAQRAPDPERGQAVYEYWCAPCHNPGPGHPGTQSLAVRLGDSMPAVLLERTDLTPEAVKVFVRQGVLSMPPFRKTEITDEELEDLAAYVAR